MTKKKSNGKKKNKNKSYNVVVKNPKKTSKKESKKTVNKNKINNTTKTLIIALILLTLSIMAILNLGIVGSLLKNILRCLIGRLSSIVLIITISLSIYTLIKRQMIKFETETLIASICLLLATLLLISMPNNKTIGFDVFKTHILTLPQNFANAKHTTLGNGGLFGAFLYSIFSTLFSYAGIYVLVIILLIASCVVYFKPDEEKIKKDENKKIDDKKSNAVSKELLESKQLLNKPKSVEKQRKEIEKTIMDNTIDTSEDVDKVKSIKKNENNIEISNTNEESVAKTYQLPSISLLSTQKDTSNSTANKKAAVDAGIKLIDVLNEFGINATLMETHIGPSVTKFEIKPDSGVKVNKISNLQNDIKMALAAKDIRIEAPIPSKNAVGVEIPNVDKNIVGLKELLKKVPEKYENKKLLFALGKDLSGQPVYGELNKMPHLLIAGATGSGKSVCVNSIITSLLMRTNPEEVKMLLIDPKKVEFTCYKDIPHLIGPIINEADEANAALKVIVEEMDRRYNMFATAGVRNISGYNEKVDKFPEEGLKKMPWIVVIIDELADLMLVAAKEVEASIQRITQLARAAGIHLVVATQRPSVDVITGLIKANIPSRIAFAVSSAIDSRTILDQQGAERLLGMGDMLYIPAGEQHPIRVQGVYVSDDEVNQICEFASKQCRPQFDEAFIRLQMVKDTIGFAGGEIDDPLYEEAKEFIIENQKASTSFLQRKFSIGYQRAARLIDLMEDNGIVGPARGSKPREVYMKKQDFNLNDDLE